MLSELYIENIAVIKKANVEFHPGFNVFTGETGAGKSVLINSLNSVSGNRTSKDIIRYETDYALIVADFSTITDTGLDYINSLNLAIDDDGHLIVERRINSSGRTSCKINSKPVSTATLKDLSQGLINIHGQNDNYNLLSQTTQLKYIDALCNHGDLLNKYKTLFKELISLRKQIKTLSVDKEEKSRQYELLSYQINEIESAALKDGELEQLKKTQELYVNAEKITAIINNLNNIYTGNKGIAEQLDEVVLNFEQLGNYIPNTSKTLSRLESACYELKDCLDDIYKIKETISYNPNELQEIEDRLDVIYKLSIKYGQSIKDILAYCDNCKKQLNDLSSSDELVEELKEKYKQGLVVLKKYASEISENRRKTANSFSQNVQKELCFLNMPNTTFNVKIEKTNLSISGNDDIQFMISANLGEPPKPIDKIASGGELSRIMLAIKSVLADKEHISTLIFDEIDAGISGKAAQKVGMKLKQLSEYCQVICITHLAQIACFADRHFLIEKNTDEAKTFTTVKQLDYEGKKRELARIISGDSNSQTALDSAEEMLRQHNPIYD